MLRSTLHVSYIVASDLVFHAGTNASVAYSASGGTAVYVAPDVVEILRSGATDAYEQLALRLDDEQIGELVAADILRSTEKTELWRRRWSNLETQIRSGKTVRFLDLVVSEGCNYGCPHCIHSQDLKTSPFRMLNTYMTPETAAAAIDEFARLQKISGNDHLAVHIGSAEPLINWKTTRFVVEYVAGIPGFSNKRITINTNLSLLTESHARFLIDHGVIISTSIDGVKEDNDTIRILKNGGGTFDIILEKIEMLRRLGYVMDSVSLTVTSRTVRTFNSRAYVDLLMRLGMTGLSVDFDLVGSSDVSADEISSFLLDLFDLCLAHGIECFGTWTRPFENLFADRDALDAPPLPGFCKAVEGGNISVSPQGRLFMCGYTSSPLGTIGGMMHEYPVRLLELLQKRTAVVETRCRGCELISVCGGQCHTTHEVASFEGSPKVQIMCDVYRTVTRELALRKVNLELCSDDM